MSAVSWWWVAAVVVLAVGVPASAAFLVDGLVDLIRMRRSRRLVIGASLTVGLAAIGTGLWFIAAHVTPATIREGGQVYTERAMREDAIASLLSIGPVALLIGLAAVGYRFWRRAERVRDARVETYADRFPDPGRPD